MNMQEVLEKVIPALREAGNGARVFVPLAGGRALRVTYLWGKFGVVLVDKAGKITEPAKRVGGSRITATEEVDMGEWAAMPTTPIQLALSEEFLPIREETYDR